MKKTGWILLLFILASCSKKGLIHLSVLEPAEVFVPKTTLKLGVLNRTLPADKTKTFDDIEKVLSAEGVNLDKIGAEEAVISFKNTISQNDRFKEIKMIDNSKLKTVGSGVFPAALTWDIVEKLCKENHVDGLVSLEYFDTNTKITFSTSPTTINTPLGSVPAVNHNANMNTTVKLGWRFYDLSSRRIIDEYHQSRYITNNSSGVNPLAAVQALMNRKEAVKQVASDAGKYYTERLIPYWVRVHRPYYIRGNDNLKMGKRKALAGNWDGAAEIWKKESSNPKAKIAGRACHNYAIIHEINGDLDEAIKWSQKAYEDYNDKISLDYVRILQNRKEKAKVLEK